LSIGRVCVLPRRSADNRLHLPCGSASCHGAKLHAARHSTRLYPVNHKSEGMLDVLNVACVEQSLDKTQLVRDALARDQESVQPAALLVVEGSTRDSSAQRLQD